MSVVLEPPLQRHRFSRAQYDQMIDAGVFAPDEKLELLDGELIDMAPQKSRHAAAVTLVSEALGKVLTETMTLRVQLPFNLDPCSVPEPDIAVVPGRPRDYRDAHPERALLIVEVAESSLAYDRGRKLAAYARAGVPVYWILDLGSATLEVCRQPAGETYAQRTRLASPDQVTPAAAPHVALSVADLLP